MVTLSYIKQLLSRMKPRFISSNKVLVLICSILFTASAFSNPVLDNVSAGNVTIQQTPGSTVVNQTSGKAVINWQSFNIGQSEQTHFQQPAGGVALNRISPTSGPSSIYGRLTATGQIILVNPAGIYFGPGAYVNVGGLIATTANISDQNFLNGNYQFVKVPGYSGAIINEGQLIAAEHGLIAVVAPAVMNKGLIQANVGKVILASGEAFTVNFSGDNLINFAIDGKTTSRGVDRNGNQLADGVANTGTILADGGQIIVSAKAAQGVLDHVINMEGMVQARSVSQNERGEIIFSGDEQSGVVRVAANIDASGKSSGQKGGNVTITGYNILLDQGTNIDVSGDIGGGNINIGGNYQGKGPLPNANALVMLSNATLNANAITSGNGGNVILWANNVTKVYGAILARGGAYGGNGGFVETSGKNYLDVNGAFVDTRAPNGNIGNWLLDPTNIWIADSLANANAAGMPGSDTSANTGSGGNPDIFQASGSVDDSLLTTSALETALGTSNVTVLTTNASGAGAGNITVVDPITWATANTLRLQANNNIIINAAITGLSGTLELQAATTAQSITTGAGGAINVANFTLDQGNWYQLNATLPTFNVTNNFQLKILEQANGSFLRAAGGSGTTIDPYMLTDIFGLQGVSSKTYLSSSFALANDIDASVTSNWNYTNYAGTLGFLPIYDITGGGQAYTGSFFGNNHTISNLYFNENQNSAFGGIGLALFLELGNGANVTNLNITNASLTGVGIRQLAILAASASSGASIDNVFTSGTIVANAFAAITVEAAAGMIGFLFNGATLTNSHSNIDITTDGPLAAGLVGYNNGSISNSYATGSVYSNNAFAATLPGVGGLVGNNDTSATISNSYSNVAVSGRLTVGGFIGSNRGSINNSFALGSVTGVASGTMQQLGGFVGFTTGTINNVFASVYVNVPDGTTQLGGFAGGGTVNPTNSFWDTDVAGKTVDGIGGSTTGGCFTGTCTNGGTADLSSQTTYTNAGWDFTTVWNIIEGESYPYLRVLNPTTPRIMTGTATGITAGTGVSVASNGVVAGTSYTGANNFYYIFLPNSAISDGGAALLYYNGATKGNLLVHGPAAGATLQGLSITNGQLTIGTSATDTYTSADLVNSIGSLANSDILYTASGNNATLTNNINLVTTGTSSFSAGGNITASGTGTLTFANAFALTADSVLTGADVNITGNIAGGGNDLTVTNTGTSSTLSGIMSNLTSFTKSGSGTLVLSGVNTYTGNTNINAGTLRLDSTGTIASSGVVLANVSGAILDLNGNSKTIASLSGGGATGGNVTLGAGTLTFGDSNNTTYDGVISGNGGSIIKQGSGTTTLGGVSTYTGSTTINLGTLAFADGVVALPTTVLTVNGSSALNKGYLDLNGNNYTSSTLSGNSFGEITNSSGSTATYTANMAGTGTYSGIISGNLNFTKTGGSQLNLASANTYTGNTFLAAGNLQLGIADGIDNILPTTTNLEVDGQLILYSSQFSSPNGVSQTVASLLDDSVGTIVNGHTFTVNQSTNTTFEGRLSGTLNFVKSGSGTLTLAPGTTYNYVGSTTINGGTLRLSDANQPGITQIIDARSVITVNNGGTFDLNGINQTTIALTSTTAGGSILLNGATFTSGNVNSSGTSSYNGTIGDGSVTGGIFIKDGANYTQVLGGANTLFTGDIQVAAGTLRITNADALGDTTGDTTVSSGATLNINGVSVGNEALNIIGTGVSSAGALTGTGTASLSGNITLAGNTTIGASSAGDALTLSGVITDGGSTFGITKIGSGTLTLSNTNTYDGGTTLSAGTLQIGAATGALGTGALALNGGTLQSSLTASLANDYTIANGVLATIGGANNLTLSGTGTFGNAGSNLNITNTANTTLSGNLSGSGSLNISAGTGTLIVSGSDNSAFNGTTVLNSGTLQIGVATNALGSSTLNLNNGTLSSSLTASLGNSYTVGNSTNATIGGSNNLTLSGTGSLGTGSTLNITNSGITTLSGNMSGAGALVANTSGTLIISGANNSSRSGSTTLTAGTMQIGVANNALGSGALNLNGGTLESSLTSALTNSYTIGNGATAAIGGSNNLTLSGTGSLGTGGTLNITNSGTTILSGNMSGAGALVENAVGGTLIISGANNSSRSGTTTLTAGTLQIGIATNALGSGSLALNGGNLQSSLAAAIANSYTVGGAAAINGSNNLNLNGAGTLNNTLTVSNTGTTTLNGSLSGNGGLTLNSAGGTLIVANINNSSFSGTTTLTNGTLQIGAATNALGSGSLALNGGTLQSSLTASLGNNYTVGGAAAIGGSNNLTLSGTGALNNTLTVSNTGTTTLSGNLSGAGGLTENAVGGTLIISGADNSSFSGTTTLTNGTMQIGVATNALGTSALNLNGGTLQSSLTASLGNNYTVGGAAAIGGSNNLTLSGTGALNNTLTVSNTGTTTLSGNLSGAGGLTENAVGGTLIISGADNSSFSGTTTLTNGTMQIGVATNALGTSALNLNGGTLQSSLTASLGNNYTVGGSAAIGGSSNLTLSGTGALNNTLTVSNTGTTTLSGILSGTGGLTENASGGTLVLSGNNTFDGAVGITAGTLSVQHANGLGSTVGGTTVSSGAVLNINGVAVGNEAVTLNGTGISSGGALIGTGTSSLSGAITLGSNSSIGGTGNTLTLSGIIDDAASTFSLTKVGTGTLNLSGANTYDGTTTVSAGTLSAQNASALGSTTGGTTVTSGATLDINNVNIGTEALTIAGVGVGSAGALTGTGAGAQANGNITLGANSTIGGTGTLTLNGIIDDGVSTFNLTKAGAGTVLLGGNNTYGGTTTISAGTLTVNATGGVIPDTSSVIMSGGTFDLANNDETIFSLQGVSGNVTLGSALLTINMTSGSVFSSANISGAGGRITKTGNGSQALNGINSYTGLTTVSGGTLVAASSSALGTTASGTVVDSGATLDIQSSGSTEGLTINGNGFGGVGALTSSSGTISFGGTILLGSNSSIGATGTQFTLTNVISDGGNGYSLTKVGTSNLILSGANTYTGATNVSAGTLSLGNNNRISDSSAVVVSNGATFNLNNFSDTVGSISGVSGSSITLGTGTLTFGGDNTDTNFAGVISDGASTGSIVKQGTGTTTLSGANTYDGTTTINAGTVVASNAAALGATTAGTTVADGATLNINGVDIGAETLNIQGSGVAGNGALIGTGTSSLSGAITFANNTTIGGTGNTLTLSGAIGDGGNGYILNKIGTGTLILSGTNTYSGATNVNNGTLQLGNSNVIADTSAISVANGATFDLANNSDTVASIAGVAGSSITLGTGTLTFGDTNDTEFAGVISDSSTGGNLVKQGSGVTTLTGANTYIGTTTINAGTIIANNATALGTTAAGTTVAAGATLNLNGFTIAEGLTLNGTGVGGNGALVGSGTVSGNVNMATDTTIGNTGALTLSGTLSGTGTNLTKIGAGALTLAGNNDYTGTTNINAGAIVASSATALGTTAGGTTVASGATLQVNGVSIGAEALTLNGTGVGGVGALLGTGTSSFGGAITLGSDATIATNALSDALSLGGTINGTQALTLAGPGTVNLGGVIGGGSALTSLTSNAGTTGINTTGITTTGAQAYNNAVTLGADAILNTTNTDVTFGSTLSNATARALTINTGLGNIGFTGNIGSGTALGAMALNSTGTTTLGGTVNAASVTTNAGGTTAINGGSVTTSGIQNYGDAVTVNADTTFTTTNSAFTLGSTLDSANATARNVAISTGSGAINLNGDIGSNNAVNNFTATNTGSTNDMTIGNDITAAGNIGLTAGRHIVLGNGNLDATGNVSLTGTAGSVSQIGTSIISGALLTVNSVGGATLNNNNTVSSFNATNTGSGNVSLTNIGALDITGINQAVGNLDILNTGAITQTGAIIANGVGRTATIAAGAANDITLTNAANDFTTLGLAANNATVTDVNSIDYDATILNGDLVSNSVGVTQSGSFANAGNSTFNAGAGAINLTQANNFGGTLALNNSGANNVSVRDISQLNLAASSVGSGTLQLTGELGIIQSGAITQTASAGAVTLNAGTNAITLNNASNHFTGAVGLNNSGANNISLVNNTALVLGASTIGSGTLSVTGVGISQTGAITQEAGAGVTTFNAGAGVINLNNSGNDLTGTVSLNNSGNNAVTLNNTGTTLTLGASSVGSGAMNVTNTGALTTAALIQSAGGDINLTTLSPDASERVLTVGATGIQSNGGDVVLTAANNAAGSAAALVVNGVVDSGPGSGGTLTIGGGLTLNAAPTVGAGNITFQGNGLDLTLGTLNFNTSVNFSVNRDILVTGNLTSSAGANLTLQGDRNNTGVGGVTIATGASVASDGNLLVQGPDIDIQNGATVSANGTINVTQNLGNSDINIASNLISNTNDAITITRAGTGVVNLSADVTGGAITFNAPVVLGATSTIDGTTINMIQGVTGGQNLNLNGSAINLAGTLALGNVAITGTGGSNSFNLNSGNAQFWSVTGANSGSASTAGVTSIAMTNVQNLTGGSGNDNFTVNGGTLSGSINGGTGTNTLVADNVANTFNITGTNAGSVTGITGGFANIQNLTGGGTNDNFVLAGGSLSGSINGGAGVNSLTANNTTNTWNITGANSGSVTGLGGTFSNIDNLTGGSANDSFALAGGTLSGSINGGAGTNSLSGTTTTSNNWSITSANTGTVDGITGTFSNIQNLTAGNLGDVFTFSDGASIGNISGGTARSTIDYTAYTSALNVNLSSTYNGVVQRNGSTITTYTNIDNMLGNTGLSNTISLPSKSNTLVITNGGIGYVNDPFNFNGFNIFQGNNSSTVSFNVPVSIISSGNPYIVSYNGVTMYFYNFNFGNGTTVPSGTTDIPGVIQQGNTPSSPGTYYYNPGSTVGQNIGDIIEDVTKQYDTDLAKIRINPYCYSTS